MTRIISARAPELASSAFLSQSSISISSRLLLLYNTTRVLRSKYTSMRPPSNALLRSLRLTDTIRGSLSNLQRTSHLPPNQCPLHRPYVSRSPLRLISREMSSTQLLSFPSSAPKNTDRGPTSTENTQTDFSAMDVFSHTPVPSASIDACLTDGFHLDNGVKITGGSGLFLVSGEAFAWRPWEIGGRGRLLNLRGQWDTGDSAQSGKNPVGAWGLLELMWPKPGKVFSCSLPFLSLKLTSPPR